MEFAGCVHIYMYLPICIKNLCHHSDLIKLVKKNVNIKYQRIRNNDCRKKEIIMLKMKSWCNRRTNECTNNGQSDP